MKEENGGAEVIYRVLFVFSNARCLQLPFASVFQPPPDIAVSPSPPVSEDVCYTVFARNFPTTCLILCVGIR